MGKKIIKFILLALIVMFATTAAYAASCPYCGQEYGESIPGDEERVNDIRRQHEAACPKGPLSKYYGYMQKFVDMGEQLKAMKYKNKDTLVPYFNDWSGKYLDISSKFTKARLGIYNKPSYSMLRRVDRSLAKCRSALFSDMIEKETSRFDSGKPYTGKHFEEFRKNLDEYFKNLEKLKVAVAEKN